LKEETMSRREGTPEEVAAFTHKTGDACPFPLWWVVESTPKKTVWERDVGAFDTRRMDVKKGKV
jgi:hypothetical protein